MKHLEAFAVLTLMQEELIHNLEHAFPVAKARLKDRFGLDLSKCDKLLDIEQAPVDGKELLIKAFGDTQEWFDILSFDVLASGMTPAGLFSVNVFCELKYKGKVYVMKRVMDNETVVFLPESSGDVFQQTLANERGRKRSKAREMKALQIVKNLMSKTE